EYYCQTWDIGIWVF
nr:immunoglobulin light chain junction region [Macaca mulatta]MOV67431.1 immunoglobulin light chain junction region [Macaca mulatta]MOV69832.1 immunoglobulin light chain junction region [Macaca mulatta]MOV69978.1 immunoglobulin light chain junction region [Macaca mulatta]MOV71331.1 immunoglobulin light chain junction region [Macaca mulatta]